MSANARTPLLANQEKIYTIDELERPREDSTDSQLTALADQLGMQADAFSGASTERDNNNTPKRDDPVITIGREQLEELITSLDTTRDLLRQVGMNSVELENLTRRRRNHRIPKFVTNHLLLLTVFWQVLNIAAVSVAEAFETQSKKEDKETKNIYLVSIIVIVAFQAANLILVFFTTIKLTKQVMHQTVTKSFLGQSFLSTTLLYAGLYTLVYKFEPDAFQNIKGAKDALSTPLVFFKMTVFSISTGTLCGSSAIFPDMWSAQLIASTQMLMSYVYFASVLYMAVQPRKSDLKWKVISRSNNYRSLNQRLT
ncbi:hypothetical protein ACROYT_G023599 [Oculina patagonica]